MLSHHFFASEAIHDVTVPSIKAWDRDAEGNVRVFQRYTVIHHEHGNTVRHPEGRDTALPLFIKAKYVAETFGRILRWQNDHRLEFRPADYQPLVEAAFASGKVDRRFCPEARDVLRNAIAERKAGNLRNSSTDVIAMTVGEAEGASLRKRLLVKTLGYSRGATSIAKLVNAVLWQDVYDREVACATILLKGVKADTRDYSAVRALWNDAPHRRFGLKSLLATHRPATIHCVDDGMHIEDELLERISSFPADLRAAGAKPAVWRMLLRMTVPQNVAIRPLVQSVLRADSECDLDYAFGITSLRNSSETMASVSLAILNRLADLGAQDCPATVLRCLARMSNHQLKAATHILSPIVARARWARRRGLVKDTARLVPLICDAYSSFANDDLQIADGRGATWDGMMRAQVEWHRQQVLARPAGDVTWPALLPEYATKVASARELTTSLELFDEGQAMDHCVGGYSHLCTGGRTRIFSIVRADGKKRSTLQVNLQPSGIWRIVQHYGYHNTDVDPKLKTWATTLLRAINRASAKAAEPPMRIAA